MHHKYLPRWKARLAALTLLTLSLQLGVISGYAQTFWNTEGGGAWSSDENWSAGVPTSALDAYFNNGATGEITFTANQGYRNLIFTGEPVDLIFSSTNATAPTLANSAGNFRLGMNSSGSSLTIEGVHIIARGASGIGIQDTAGIENISSNNSLVIDGSTSVFEVAATAQLAVGRVTATGTTTADQNSITVKNGGLLKVGALALGTDGTGNAVTVTGSGSQLVVNGGAGFNLDIGSGTKADKTNVFSITQGASATVSQAVRIFRGQLKIGESSTITASNGLQIGLGGQISGKGLLIANVQQAAIGSGSGAVAEVGDGVGDFGVLTTQGNWNNNNITLKLEIGQVTEGDLPGVSFDQLNVLGIFSLAGSVSIDLAAAVFPGSDELLKVIAWESSVGNPADLHVSFLNGTPLEYMIKDDGLYIQAVPEPSALALVGVAAILMWRRIRRNPRLDPLGGVERIS